MAQALELEECCAWEVSQHMLSHGLRSSLSYNQTRALRIWLSLILHSMRKHFLPLSCRMIRTCVFSSRPLLLSQRFERNQRAVDW